MLFLRIPHCHLYSAVAAAAIVSCVRVAASVATAAAESAAAESAAAESARAAGEAASVTHSSPFERGDKIRGSHPNYLRVPGV